MFREYFLWYKWSNIQYNSSFESIHKWCYFGLILILREYHRIWYFIHGSWWGSMRNHTCVGWLIYPEWHLYPNGDLEHPWNVPDFFSLMSDLFWKFHENQLRLSWTFHEICSYIFFCNCTKTGGQTDRTEQNKAEQSKTDKEIEMKPQEMPYSLTKQDVMTPTILQWNIRFRVLRCNRRHFDILINVHQPDVVCLKQTKLEHSPALSNYQCSY